MDKLRIRHWDGQLDGTEGLNQATWSTTTYCAGLKSCIETLGMIYQMSVKGDDVRAVVLINRDVFNRLGLKAAKNDLLRELQVLCDAMGWQLNPQECFVSLSLICTSKQYQVKDTWLHLKR